MNLVKFFRLCCFILIVLFSNQIAHAEGMANLNKIRICQFTNANSGEVLVQGHFGKRTDDLNVGTWPASIIKLTDQKGATWEMRKEGEYVRLINMQSGKNLVQGYFGKRANDRNVNTWPLDQTYEGGGGRWSMRVIEELPIPHFPTKNLIPEESLKPRNGVLPKTFEEGFTEASWVSCLFVIDNVDPGPAKTIEWKLKNSPYYQLGRESKWELKDQLNNVNAHAENVLTLAVEHGVSTESMQSFTATVGFSFSSEVGLPGAKVTSTFSASFSSTFSNSFSTSLRRIRTVTLNVPPGEIGGIYSRSSMLVLRRAPSGSSRNYKKITSVAVEDGETATVSFKP